MVVNQQTLLGLAGTRYSNAVVSSALDIAKEKNASITAVTALNLRALRNVGPTPIGGGQQARELREHRLEISRESVEAAIEHFEMCCKEAGIVYQIKKEERDDPFDFLISQSRYHDLTVLSLRGIFEYDSLQANESDASVTLIKLITSGVQPIVAVPPEPRQVKRVFVAYSGSVESASTLRRFLQLRPYKNIDLRIATFEMEEERSKHLLADAARYCKGYGIDAETVHIPKSAHDNLLDEATACDADIIVLGNSAKSLIVRKIFGETALKAIRESMLPVFLSQ